MQWSVDFFFDSRQRESSMRCKKRWANCSEKKNFTGKIFSMSMLKTLWCVIHWCVSCVSWTRSFIPQFKKQKIVKDSRQSAVWLVVWWNWFGLQDPKIKKKSSLLVFADTIHLFLLCHVFYATVASNQVGILSAVDVEQMKRIVPLRCWRSGIDRSLEKKIKWYFESRYWQDLNRIDGKSLGFVLITFLGFKTLDILEEIHKEMKDWQCEPEHVKDRIIFMSMLGRKRKWRKMYYEFCVICKICSQILVGTLVILGIWISKKKKNRRWLG